MNKVNRIAQEVAEAYCAYVWAQHAPNTSSASKMADIKAAKSKLDTAMVKYKKCTKQDWDYL